MKYLLVTVLALQLAACSDSSSDNEIMLGDDAFILSSPAVVNGELLTEFQCEEKLDNGTENSIPLEWSGMPEETQSLAIVMYHYPNADDTTMVIGYLSLWGIDPDVTEIPYAAADDGPWFMGANKDGVAISYSSPCSPSIGSHSYTIALYALASDTAANGLLPAQSSLNVDYAELQSAVEEAGIISQSELVFNSTTGGATNVDSGVAASSCEDYAGAFAPLSDLVSYECGDTFLSLTTETGLPPTQNVTAGEDIMVGITSWIQRLPIPYTYEWKIPLNPAWSNVTSEASARGPIAVAVDGVPIFHYERRPDVSTALDVYTQENDTVLAGELDQYGEPATTLMTGFSLSDDGQYTLEFDALDGSGVTSSVIYSVSSTSDACWDFEFRADASQIGEVRTACREDATAALISAVQSLEHGHEH